MPWTTPETFTAGQTLTAASMNVISGNLSSLTNARRLGYVEKTDGAYTTAYAFASLSSASNIFSSSITFTADGTSQYLVEFFTPRLVSVNVGGHWTQVTLVNGSGTALGCMGIYFNGSNPGVQTAWHSRVMYTPAAGSVTLNARATSEGSTGFAYYGGTGGTGSLAVFPMYLAVFGPTTTT